MSDIYAVRRRTLTESVVVGKTCDVCSKDIPPTSREFPRTMHPYYRISTHHNDWGNDSVDSYEYFHACSPACAMKFTEEYLKDFDKQHSRCIEIEHVSGWYMLEEEEND